MDIFCSVISGRQYMVEQDKGFFFPVAGQARARMEFRNIKDDQGSGLSCYCNPETF